jgi:hypothetical protein
MRKIYKTPEVERQYKRVFKETAKRFGKRVALETMRQLKEAEEKLAKDAAYTRHDPEDHSKRFEYITIQNSQTLFFEYINDGIIIVAAGWSGRNWKDRLEEMQPYIDRQLEKFKKQKEK